MDLVCFDVDVDNVTYFIDCNLIIYSQSIQNSVYIDYGDCFNETTPSDATGLLYQIFRLNTFFFYANYF